MHYGHGVHGYTLHEPTEERPFRPGIDPYRFVALATVDGEGDDVEIISETHVYADTEERAREKILKYFTTRYQWRHSTNQREVLLPLMRIA